MNILFLFFNNSILQYIENLYFKAKKIFFFKIKVNSKPDNKLIFEFKILVRYYLKFKDNLKK